jgi:hypothetical protein
LIHDESLEAYTAPFLREKGTVFPGVGKQLANPDMAEEILQPERTNRKHGKIEKIF